MTNNSLKVIVMCSVLFLLHTTSFPTHAKASNKALTSLVEKVCDDLGKGNKEGVVRKIHIPLKIVTKKGTHLVKTKRECLKYFDKIFNQNVRTILSSQGSEEPITNSSGYGLWRGSVWIDEFGGVLKIKSIRIDMKKAPGKTPDFELTDEIFP